MLITRRYGDYLVTMFAKRLGLATVDEREPLLSDATADDQVRPVVEQVVPTPLPKLQMTILVVLQMVEPMTSKVIYPFINQVCHTSVPFVSMSMS